jgi:WD40 repeat protein
LIAALSVGKIDLLDGFSGHKIRTLSYSARRAAFSPDGQHLYAVSGSSQAVSEAEVRVWNVATGILLHIFPASGLAFGPGASQIITFEGSVARVRDMMNGAVVREFDNGDRIPTGKFRPDGKLAAICSYRSEKSRTLYGLDSGAFANTDVWDLTGRPPPSELTLFGHEALFLISQAFAFLTAPPLEGATPGERMMRTLMVPIDQRRLTTVLQSECDIWPAGEEEVFKSLLGLRERIGRIQQEQDHVISGAVDEDADYRQRLATQILSGLVESIRILKISAGSDKARHRVDELIKRLAPLVSPEENALVLGLSSALDVGLADPSGRLVKFIDTPAGQSMQNERLRDWANTLDRTKGALRELEVRAAPEEATPEPLTRGFWARLFGRGRRP